MIASYDRKLVLVLLAAALVASASYGGWQLFRSEEPAVPIDPPAQQPAPLVQTVSVPPTAAAPESASSKSDPAPAKQPVPTAVNKTPKKTLPTGKKHLKQDDLLTAMATQLHGEAYFHFIQQKGMGMYRMMPTITLVQREWKMPKWTSEEITKEQPPKKGERDLSMIHAFSLGFHQILDAPIPVFSTTEVTGTGVVPMKKEQAWEIHSLDLVGLVVHDVPKVYVSKQLPQMKNLKTTPIRELDVFESEGLEELVNGKDLYIRSKEGTVRVLGPIRAGKACLKCHGDAKEADMLGAFSYTLRPAEYRVQGVHGLQPGNGFATPKGIPNGRK